MRKNKAKEPWTDETIMPWGKFKGRKLEDVPADYFMWLMEQHWLPKWPQLKAYIDANADAIYAEAEENREDDDDTGREFSTYQDFLDHR